VQKLGKADSLTGLPTNVNVPERRHCQALRGYFRSEAAKID
jgi:hypothetical protein